MYFPTFPLFKALFSFGGGEKKEKGGEGYQSWEGQGYLVL